MCIGTDEEKEDIFPCTWVGHNVSGTIMIDTGWLTINGIQVRRVSEFNPVQPDKKMSSLTTIKKHQLHSCLYISL
jgi:hypothetical protein